MTPFVICAKLSALTHTRKFLRPDFRFVMHCEVKRPSLAETSSLSLGQKQEQLWVLDINY